MTLNIASNFTIITEVNLELFQELLFTCNPEVESQLNVFYMFQVNHLFILLNLYDIVTVIDI